MFDGIANALGLILTISISLIPSLGGFGILGLIIYLALVGD